MGYITSGKNYQMKSSTRREATKVGTTPQYFCTIPKLYLVPFFKACLVVLLCECTECNVCFISKVFLHGHSLIHRVNICTAC